MEGSNKDAGTHGKEIRRYWKTFGNWLRNRLGERQPFPVAPGLFAVLFFAGLVSILPADKVGAVPVCQNNLNCARFGIESGRADWNLYGYNLVGFNFPRPMSGGFNEGDNIEWIYHALENQYAFLDDTLYRITGGCYLLGSVCYPHWHGFRYYCWARDPDREIIYIPRESAFYIDNRTFAENTVLTAPDGGNEWKHHPAGFRRIHRKIYPESELYSDTETVPEPSTFILFGLAAGVILRHRKSAGN
jgi:hypothetical protein